MPATHFRGPLRVLRIRLLATCGIILGFLSYFAAAAPVQLDPAFIIGTGAGSTVNNIAEQPDGSVWIAGSFFSYNGVTQYSIAKLGATGTLDTGFAPPSTVNQLNRMIPLASGKVLVGFYSAGSFGTPTYRRGIARLHADGTVDTTFDASPTVTDTVFAIEVLADGRISVVMPAGVASGIVEITTQQGAVSSGSSVTAWDITAGSQIVTSFGV